MLELTNKNGCCWSDASILRQKQVHIREKNRKSHCKTSSSKLRRSM